MYSFKTNPKNKRKIIFLAIIYLVIIKFFIDPITDKGELLITSILCIMPFLFLYLEGKATFTVTEDSYIYNYFGEKIFSKDKYKLRAGGLTVRGFGDNAGTCYQLRIIHNDSYEMAQEIKMSMEYTEYTKHCLALKRIGEFK